METSWKDSERFSNLPKDTELKWRREDSNPESSFLSSSDWHLTGIHE